MQAINAALLDTIAACGDVNRNVMCSCQPVPIAARTPRRTSWPRDLASTCCRRRAPITRSGSTARSVAGGDEDEVEPIYGRPTCRASSRSCIAVPPSNDVDIFAHDLGFIAIVDEDGKLVGFNVTVGGGMGMTHGEPDTYPRIADVWASARPSS